MTGLSLDIPVLETERLVLRAHSLDDLDAEVAFYESDRCIHVGGRKTRDDVWRLLATFIGHWAFRGYGFWAIEDRETRSYQGRVGLWYPGGWPEPEIGWVLMGNGEGRGFATEAAIAARNYAYETLGWTTAISLIDPENARSQAVATRLGAQRCGTHFFKQGDFADIWRHPGPEGAA